MSNSKCFFFAVLFLILTSSVLFSVALQQINQRNFDVVNDKRLLSGSIATTSVRSALACVALCTFDQGCCSSNYEEGSKLCRLETSCSPAMEQFNDSLVMKKVVNWLPVFVAYSGNEQSVYEAWTNQEECDDLLIPLDISVTTKHLRNPLIDRWSDVIIRKVKVELLKYNTAVAWIIFNAENTNNMNWFRKENLLNSSFDDLTTSSSTNVFDIRGDWGLERQFFINRNYGSCASDGGWFVVSGKRQDCAWEKKGVYPVFLYTKNGFNRNWHTDSAEPADRMIISVGI